MTETGRVYSGRSADQRDADRRQRLLDAGHDLFGSDGYATTSIERLCTTATVSTRSFYTLFANKEECFLAVYDRVIAESIARATSSLESTEGQPLADRAPAAFLAYLDPMLTDLSAARIAFVESIGVSSRSEEHRLGFRDALIAVIATECAAAVRRGEIADRDFRVAALALIGAGSAIVYDWIRNTPGVAPDALRRELADVCLRLLVS